MSLKIVTDSACDLPRDIIDNLDILTLPLNVLEGDREYRDKETITPKELYAGMRAGSFYKTSQSLPNIILNRIRAELDRGSDIIYICFSSGLSGQFQTVNLLFEDLRREYGDSEIHLVDSRASCCGMGMMVKKAGEMAQAGRSIGEILEMLDFYVENMEHIILVDKMDYLYKGGRIGRVKALTGGLLNIKPIVGIDDLGRLKFIDKVRGRKKLFRKTEELILEANLGDIKDQTIGLVYGDNEEMARDFIDFLNESLEPRDIIVENIGASVAAHTGPDIIGITFLRENYK